MQHHVLTPGTILVGRYRIDALLGEGGYGITYAATQLSMDCRVAVKELFWHDHSVRDCHASPEVALSSEEDRPEFTRQREKFLDEARTLLRFRELGGVVHVLEFFEANNTAYIVMEYVEGETLRAKLDREGPMQAEPLFRLFVPLLMSLAQIHGAKVLHRDISPENIMVLPDGRLKLIDFGAAREMSGGEAQGLTAIVKESYAPAEQYDRKGRQGPWTDLYAVCATLYAALTGHAPLGSVQRMFLDELQPPSKTGVEIDPAYEAVVMKGLAMKAEERWQSAEELANAMLKVLPTKKKKGLFERLRVPMIVGVVCAALAAGGILWWVNRAPAAPLGGRETELIFLESKPGMSAESFTAAEKELRASLDELVGEDNYLLSADGTRYRLDVPLELFGGRDIEAVLREQYLPPFTDFDPAFEIKFEWEDPATSNVRGANQVRGDAFDTETVAYALELGDSKDEKELNIAGLVFKNRLDALGIPYAVGRVMGTTNTIAYRIAPERIGRFVTETVGVRFPFKLGAEGMDYRAEYDLLGQDVLGIVEREDGHVALRVEVNDPEELSEKIALMRAAGVEKYYLVGGKYGTGEFPIADVALDDIVDGVIEFDHFMIPGHETLGAEDRYIADYIAALGTPEMPIMHDAGDGVWDAQGVLLPDEEAKKHLGISCMRYEEESRLVDMLYKIRDEQGFGIGEGSTFFINLLIEPDSLFEEKAEAALTTLFENYDLASCNSGKGLLITLIPEQDSERFRITINLRFDAENGRFYHEIGLYCLIANDSGNRIQALEGAFEAWWRSFPVEKYGFVREPEEERYGLYPAGWTPIVDGKPYVYTPEA